jgi:sec-independent protein translocase protein TatC
VLLTLMARVGIVQVETLKKGRRYAIVIMFVVAAIITPPDIISQIGLAIPLILLYELSIIVATLMLRGQKKREEAAEAATKT